MLHFDKSGDGEIIFLLLTLKKYFQYLPVKYDAGFEDER